MKKAYMNPNTSIVVLNMHAQLMAGSVNTNASGDVESVDISDENYSGGSVLSRRRNLWDEEEEEDLS